MSDEIIERRTLRGQHYHPGPGDPPTPPPHDPETGPVYGIQLTEEELLDGKPPVSLMPPDEAGDVIKQQAAMPTRLDLHPITGEYDIDELPWDTFDMPFEDLPESPPVFEPPPSPVDRRVIKAKPVPDEAADRDSMLKLPKVEIEPEDESEPEPEPEAEPAKEAAVVIDEPAKDDDFDPDETSLGYMTPAQLVRVPADREDAPPEGEEPRQRVMGRNYDTEWVMKVGEEFELEEVSELKRPGPRRFNPFRELERLQRMNAGQIANLVMVLILSVILVGVILWRVSTGGFGRPGAGVDATPLPLATALPTPTAGAAAVEEPTPTLSAPYAEGRIAYASNRSGDFGLYILDLRTGFDFELTDGSSADRTPTWSPDGRRVLFVSNRDGDDNLYVIDVDGTRLRQVTSDPAADRFPAWSPDGDRILFSRETLDGSLLLGIDADCIDDGPEACEASTVTVLDEGHFLHARWSPDGKQFVVTASDFPGMASVIALVNPDGSGLRARVGTGASDFSPAYAPDGSRLAFVSNSLGDFDIWTMPLDGSAVIQMTAQGSDDVAPAFSPNGQYLVYASDRAGTGGFDLWVMDAGCAGIAEGCEANAVRLTPEDVSDELDPAWTAAP